MHLFSRQEDNNTSFIHADKYKFEDEQSDYDNDGKSVKLIDIMSEH
jgi:hypothetical protein